MRGEGAGKEREIDGMTIITIEIGAMIQEGVVVATIDVKENAMIIQVTMVLGIDSVGDGKFEIASEK